MLDIRHFIPLQIDGAAPAELIAKTTVYLFPVMILDTGGDCVDIFFTVFAGTLSRYSFGRIMPTPFSWIRYELRVLLSPQH